jgi:uncharacterized membrane protein YgcG
METRSALHDPRETAAEASEAPDAALTDDELETPAGGIGWWGLSGYLKKLFGSDDKNFSGGGGDFGGGGAGGSW